MKKETLENINSDLFNSFNPEDELWIVGSGTGSVTGSITFAATSRDGSVDGDADFGFSEDEIGG
jgi:hypothetical protein